MIQIEKLGSVEINFAKFVGQNLNFQKVWMKIISVGIIQET